MSSKLGLEDGVVGNVFDSSDIGLSDDCSVDCLSQYNPDANGLARQVNLERYHRNRKQYHMMQNWLKVNGRL